MKTMNQIADENCCNDWGSDRADVIAAMKQYTEQIIDLCAESAITKLDTVLDKNERPWSMTVVDKESILKVKEMIK